jgi:hypothetical protein
LPSTAPRKTIAAFLNTEGGDLLIGVADDGLLVGIESDRLESEDKSEAVAHDLGEVPHDNKRTSRTAIRAAANVGHHGASRKETPRDHAATAGVSRSTADLGALRLPSQRGRRRVYISVGDRGGRAESRCRLSRKARCHISRGV